jgi:hypothetical protein
LFDVDILLAYCQARIHGMCNRFIECSLGDQCIAGQCQTKSSKFIEFFSLDIITISIVVSSSILLLIVIVLTISLCILRQQRWKQRSHLSINSIDVKKQQITSPTTSDYDNITYGVFRQNVHLSAIDESINDRSTFATTDSSSYNPKVVYLGGEQQLTAIYA